MQRQSIIHKAEKVKETSELLLQYKTIGIASLRKVRASQLQELRKTLKGRATLCAIKNSIVDRAISETDLHQEKAALREYLKGSNIFLLTDLNPFKLFLLLGKSKVKAFAKVGDTAAEDVIVPAGNTGIQPGPIISQLSSVGIPTRIESGSVHINKDTLVVKEGETISENLAPLLSKLGIKAVEMGLDLKVVYDSGEIIAKQQLDIDLDSYKQNLSEAYNQSLNTSVKAVFPIAENIMLLVQTSHWKAYNIALRSNFPCKETIQEILSKAQREALSVSSRTQPN